VSSVFASNHPLVAHMLSRLRAKDTEPKKLRGLVREISALLAYEATADLIVVPRQLETPLARVTGRTPGENRLGTHPARRPGHGG
jgi:uracil phosphoribosyltransferase